MLQTDWNPEAEHGGQYELLGPNPTINAGAKSVTGELVAHGGIDTGVQLQIRAGGPAIGYQTVSSQMYKDSSITLGYLGTDEQIALSQTQPTVAVMAGLEVSPQIIQWSPTAHPDLEDDRGHRQDEHPGAVLPGCLVHGLPDRQGRS